MQRQVAMGYYPLRNATSRWLPSQYGFLFDCPQRQSQVSVTRLTVFPVPVTTSRLPVTCKGPSGVGSMVSGPSRFTRGVESTAATSPLATKLTVAWLPSQNGLCVDAPHRHSVSRNPSARPCMRMGARTESGPFSLILTVLTLGADSNAVPSAASHRMAPEGQL